MSQSTEARPPSGSTPVSDDQAPPPPEDTLLLHTVTPLLDEADKWLSDVNSYGEGMCPPATGLVRRLSQALRRSDRLRRSALRQRDAARAEAEAQTPRDVLPELVDSINGELVRQRDAARRELQVTEDEYQAVKQELGATHHRVDQLKRELSAAQESRLRTARALLESIGRDPNREDPGSLDIDATFKAMARELSQLEEEVAHLRQRKNDLLVLDEQLSTSREANRKAADEIRSLREQLAGARLYLSALGLRLPAEPTESQETGSHVDATAQPTSTGPGVAYGDDRPPPAPFLDATHEAARRFPSQFTDEFWRSLPKPPVSRRTGPDAP